jgi:hypothetical protein
MTFVTFQEREVVVGSRKITVGYICRDIESGLYYRKGKHTKWHEFPDVFANTGIIKRALSIGYDEDYTEYEIKEVEIWERT